MVFVYEIVPEKDYEFFKSMGLKNCWGTKPQIFLPGRSDWTADRAQNAFLVPIGGGMHDVPLIYDLWWNGDVIRLEAEDFQSEGNRRESFKLVWNVNKVLIPKSVWEKRDLIIKMIEDAMLVNQDGVKKENLNSIVVNMSNAAAIEVGDSYDITGSSSLTDHINKALPKILCKNKPNQTKAGLQRKRNLGFPLDCPNPAG